MLIPLGLLVDDILSTKLCAKADVSNPYATQVLFRTSASNSLAQPSPLGGAEPSDSPPRFKDVQYTGVPLSRLDAAHLEGNLYKPNVERSLLILNNMSGFGNSTVDTDILKTLNQYGTF
jgi:hypothetical protein